MKKCIWKVSVSEWGQAQRKGTVCMDMQRREGKEMREKVVWIFLSNQTRLPRERRKKVYIRISKRTNEEALFWKTV